MPTTKNLCKAVITVLSTMTHCSLSEQEKAEERRNMQALIQDMDAACIPWALQNSLFYVGEQYDVRICYLDRLLTIALQRAGMEAIPA